MRDGVTLNDTMLDDRISDMMSFHYNVPSTTTRTVQVNGAGSVLEEKLDKIIRILENLGLSEPELP